VVGELLDRVGLLVLESYAGDERLEGAWCVGDDGTALLICDLGFPKPELSHCAEDG
jgi:hypothetical protein